MGTQSKKDSFIMQAGILAAAGFITKIIGTLYRTPLTAIIGNEGNGYYSAAYYVYLIILTIASYSMPTAISKIVSSELAVKHYRNAQKIFRCALIYVTVMGVIASVFLFFGADLFLEPNSAVVLRVFTPTIVIYGYLGVLRGYFQAHRSMTQTSVSQILEQIANAFVSVFGAYFMVNLAVKQVEKESGMLALLDPAAVETKKAIYGASASAAGTGSGVLIALLFMIGMYLLNKKLIHKRIKNDRSGVEESYGAIFKSLMLIVTPIIISSCIYNMNTVVNQTVFVKILMNVKEFTESQASKLYGVFSGRAVVIANIPVAVGAAMSSALIPTISSSYAKGEIASLNQKVAGGIKATMLISIPAAVGIAVLARPIMYLLSPEAEHMDMAIFLLQCMSITVIFYQLSTISNGVLQGIGKVNIPVINSAIALGLQTLLIIPLLIYTDLNENCLVIATIFYSFTICMLNQRSVRKYLGYRQEMLNTFMVPFVSSAVMGIMAFLVYEGLLLIHCHYVIALFAAVFVAVLVYFVVVIKLGGMTEEDMRRLPKGHAIVRLAKKMRLIA